MRGHNNAERARGLGPFTGGHLTAMIIAVVAVVGLPMIAHAAIPNGNTFHACTNKKTGALRLIDTGKKQKCNTTTENAVSWSKTGPKGATGAPGHGRLIYQHEAYYHGAYTVGSTGTIATFAVPAGLMCITGYGTAFESATLSPAPIGAHFLPTVSGAGPELDVLTVTNYNNDHRTLIPVALLPNCKTVSAGTLNYHAQVLTGFTSTDDQDFASLSVKVYSS